MARKDDDYSVSISGRSVHGSCWFATAVSVAESSPPEALYKGGLPADNATPLRVV